MRPPRSMEIDETRLRAQKKGISYVLLSCRSLGNASTLFEKKPEDREFVVDSGVSRHMLSKRDLSSDELETLRRSTNPITVVTASGEVQTNEETQVHVHDLHLVVTVQLLEDTPAVLSLGKLCEERGYTNEWASGQKPHLPQRWEDNSTQDGTCRACCCPGIIRLPHRFRRIHQVLRIQQVHEVTKECQGTGAVQISKPKCK